MATPSYEYFKGLSANQMRKDIDAGKYTENDLRRARDWIAGKRPGFLQRLGAGFATSPEGEANIYRNLGYNAFARGNDVYLRTPNKWVKVDPEGFDIGDIADIGGEVPAIAGGAAGGLLGLGAGPVAGPAVAAGLGGVGSAGGEYLRQQIAQGLGSGEDTKWGRVAAEGALGVGGEVVGHGVGKLLGGAFKRSTGAPDLTRTMKQAEQFDVKYGTDLAEKAPVDVQTGSEALGQFTQRIRESPYGGQRLREGQDIPFQQEMEKGFEAIRSSTGLGRQGTEAEAGQALKEAQIGTTRERLGERKKLYEAFGKEIDRYAVPAMENAEDAINEIMESNIFKRKKIGAQGLDQLRNAIDEVSDLIYGDAKGKYGSFDELVTERQALQDEISQWDPAKLAAGVQGQMKKLLTALRKDEDVFLETGGRRSMRVAGDLPPAAPAGAVSEAETGQRQVEALLDFGDVPEEVVTETGRKAVVTMTPNQVIQRVGGIKESEVNRFVRGSAIEGKDLSLIKRMRGKNRGGAGLTLEEVISESMQHPELASVLRQANIETAEDLIDSSLRRTLWKKYPASVDVEDVSREILGRPEEMRAGIDWARRQLPEIRQQIFEAESLDDLRGIGTQLKELRHGDVLDDVDIDEFRTLVAQKAKQISAPPSTHPAVATDVPEPVYRGQSARVADDIPALPPEQISSTAVEAGLRAKRFAQDLFKVDESPAVAKALSNVERLSDLPRRLRQMTPEEIRSIRLSVGSIGSPGGLQPNKEGIEAWRRMQAEILDDIKAKSKTPDKSTEDRFVISGARMLSELDEGFKPGALQEIFGADIFAELRSFANLARNMDVTERQFANWTRTAMAQSNILHDLGGVLSSPIVTLGKVAGKIGAERLGGKMGEQAWKQRLLGKQPWQQQNPRLLQLLGRTAGQAGVHSLPRVFGAR